MDLLARDLTSITFSDVVDFCAQQIVENAVLDYKRAIPRDLAKHISAMSNRMGGLIIIGVEEDPRTSAPGKYEGIQNDGKLTDRVHQHANNVRPLPSYDVRTTNEVAGKAFLLVRVNEGAVPPYTTVNDPTVYLRTGNITTPLGPADNNIMHDLHNKRLSAERTRRHNIDRAKAVLLSVLEQEDAKLASPVLGRNMANRIITSSGQPFSTETFLGSRPLLTAYLQPFHPGRELAAPREILMAISIVCVDNPVRQQGFPADTRMRPITRGMLSFNWVRSGPQFICDQIYANGFFVHAECAGALRKQSSDGQIFMWDIANILYMTLLFGRNLYQHLGYTGVTEGAIELTGVREREIHLIGPVESGFIDHRAIDSAYTWRIKADTHQLGDDSWLHEYFYALMREIYWDLGVVDVSRSEFSEFTPEMYSD